MAYEILDENRIPVVLGVSEVDGTTTIPIKANPAVHAMKCLKGSTGSDLSGDDDARDENRKPAFFAVSATDGVTPVAVYCDINGNLLIQTT